VSAVTAALSERERGRRDRFFSSLTPALSRRERGRRRDRFFSSLTPTLSRRERGRRRDRFFSSLIPTLSQRERGRRRDRRTDDFFLERAWLCAEIFNYHEADVSHVASIVRFDVHLPLSGPVISLVRDPAPALFLSPGDGERNAVVPLPTASGIAIRPAHLEPVAEVSRSEDPDETENAIARAGEEGLITMLPNFPRRPLVLQLDRFSLP